MMKKAWLLGLVGGVAFGATGPSLESQLQTLKLEQKRVPVSVPSENFYAAQSRYSPLKSRLEFDIGGAKNFNPSSFLSQEEVHGDLRFYFTNRFYAGVHGAYVFNHLSPEGNRLWEKENIFPDISLTRFRSDLTLGYHLFYGKFRLSMDTVFYFDQYWAIGAGLVGTDNGLTRQTMPAVVADVGFAFWFGRHWSLRVGLKDYYFKEVRRTDESRVNHFVGHASLGFVFGGGEGA